MNKAIRIISIILLAVLVIGAIATPVLAADVDVNSFSGDTSDTEGITNIFNKVIGIVQVIGTGVAVIMLIYIAIKYLVASPEGKGELKKSAIMYVVAAVILFAAVNILAIIQGWANTVNEIS